jgi:two-component system sensor histidine kinase PhoQ
MHSLNTRLLVVATIVLAVFLGLTGLTLDRGFRDSALGGVRDRLQAVIYLILGAGDLDEQHGLLVPGVLPDPRLSTPDSGLYAEVVDASGKRIWRSASSVGREIAYPEAADPGELVLERVVEEQVYAIAFVVAWEIGPDKVARYTVRAAESEQGFEQQVTRFRRDLWSWFAGVVVVLLVVQAGILRWGLAPLRRVADEVTNIEIGRQKELLGPYPREMEPLTQNLNALIENSRAHLERYRNALADLAHSLKTPLAVLRATLETEAAVPKISKTVDEQLVRLDKIVEYQLQRAAASGRTALTAPLGVHSVIARVTESLEKIYREKHFEVDVDDRLEFYADEGDLIEIIGNLADNAGKWSNQRIRIEAERETDPQSGNDDIVIRVVDDGPGFPVELLATAAQRGMRGDPAIAGHGIGLSIVRELVAGVYGGTLKIDNLDHPSGARVEVRIPI